MISRIYEADFEPELGQNIKPRRHLSVCASNFSLFSAAETDALLSAQNSLIKTLKEECCQLGAKLEDVLERKRSEHPVLKNPAFGFTTFASSLAESVGLFFLLEEQLFVLSLRFVPSVCLTCHRFTEHHPSRLFSRTCPHTTNRSPVWPVFLLTWCRSSHSRPAQLSIWAECVCACVWVTVTMGPVSCQLLELCCTLVTWQTPIWHCQTTLALLATQQTHTHKYPVLMVHTACKH